MPVCERGGRNYWAGPPHGRFVMQQRRWERVNAELGKSYTLLPVTRTTDEWSHSSDNVWMYYGRGCSDIMWCTGRTLGGVHKLHVAAALMQEDEPSCDLECVSTFFASYLSGAAGQLGMRRADVNTVAVRRALDHKTAWYNVDAALGWYRMTSCGNLLNLWMYAAARRRGYDSLQFYASPTCPPGGGRFAWHAELVDLREPGTNAVTQTRRDGPWVRNNVFCRGEACRPPPAFDSRNVGECLSCLGCSGAC